MLHKQMLRRLLLVGFAVIILPGTVTQLVVGFLVSFVYLVVPYDRRTRPCGLLGGGPDATMSLPAR